MQRVQAVWCCHYCRCSFSRNDRTLEGTCDRAARTACLRHRRHPWLRRTVGKLHEIIAEDLVHRPVDEPVLLHIGDYVDRGADTAGVLRRLLRGSPVAGMTVVNLVGNHDETMLNALSGDRPAATDWLFAGGRPALESYGIDPDSPRESWPENVPRSTWTFSAT